MTPSRSHRHTFEERLAAYRAQLERKAVELEAGPVRDDLLRKLRQIDTAENLSKLLNSPGLQPPK